MRLNFKPEIVLWPFLRVLHAHQSGQMWSKTWPNWPKFRFCRPTHNLILESIFKAEVQAPLFMCFPRHRLLNTDISGQVISSIGKFRNKIKFTVE